MSEVHYHYNSDTASYTPVKYALLRRLGRWALIITGTVTGALVLVFVYVTYFEVQRDRASGKALTAVTIRYSELSERLDNFGELVASIETQDDKVYRTILRAEPIDKGIRNSGTGGNIQYQEIRQSGMPDADLIAQLYARVDKLRRKIYVEIISQDELIKLLDQREDLLASLPAIQPLSNNSITCFSSGFGLRMHPFYEVIKMHNGMDFAAPDGSPIFATANGVIIAADTAFAGYGTMVIIDHGYGYQTRYAHIREFLVNPGAVVQRGQLIAYVGNTGHSTAPHLHYEVLVNGLQQDPSLYFTNDLSDAEFEMLTYRVALQLHPKGQ